MRSLTLLSIAFLIISCNKIDKDSEKEKSLLEFQIDSLQQRNEHLTTTRSFLFENALNLEETDKEAAISIYTTITNTKQGDFWAVESEKRIVNLTKETSVKKPFYEDFHWLFRDTLKLFQENEKCGEWGGDREIIKIFWKSRKLIGYYTKETFNCDSLELYMYSRATPSIYKSKEIEITPQHIELLQEAIIHLTKHKITNSYFPGHSGIVNMIQIKGKNDDNKNLFVEDYSSYYWNTFHTLKNNMLSSGSLGGFDSAQPPCD